MVDRCVCYNRLFSEMKNIIDRNNLNSIDELKNHILFGLNCSLCIPYVELIFKTGKTEFEVINQ